MLPDGAELESEENRVTVRLKSSKKPVQLRNFSVSTCCALRLASETQPHWRSLARLKGKREPGIEAVIRKGGQKKKNENTGIVFEIYKQKRECNSAFKHVRCTECWMMGRKGGVNRELKEGGLILE